MRSVDTTVLAALRAVLTNVHDGKVPVDDSDPNIVTAALPYVVFYSNIGMPEELRRMSGRNARDDVDFQVTYVGGTRDQAKWAGERARGALRNLRLHPNGPRVRVVESQRVLKDNDAHQPNGGALFYGVDQYAARSTI